MDNQQSLRVALGTLQAIKLNYNSQNQELYQNIQNQQNQANAFQQISQVTVSQKLDLDTYFAFRGRPSIVKPVKQIPQLAFKAKHTQAEEQSLQL